MSPKAGRGAFILVEGLDRSGKSTQCEKIVDSMRSSERSVELIRFPNRETQIGQMISAYLKQDKDMDDRCIHLLFSANRWEAANEMERKLEQGITLICDRYAYSGVAFTAAKGGLSVPWCKGPDRGLPKPDVVIFLTISPEEAAKRGDYGDERYEKQEFQEKVGAVFEQLRKDDEPHGPPWSIVDAGKSRNAVLTDMLEIVDSTMKKVQDSGAPLSRLWGDI